MYDENILFLNSPIDYFLNPIVSKVDLVKGLSQLGIDIGELTTSISNRYDNIDNNEDEVSRIIRLSILIHRNN